MKDPYNPAYDEDDQEEAAASTSAPLVQLPLATTVYQPQPASPLPNPVIRSFDGPTQASTNTVPAPAQVPGQPQPQLASDASPYPAAPPRVARTQPVASSAPAAPAATSSFQVPLQPATPATPANPFPLPPTPYAAPAPVSAVYRPADAPQLTAADFQAQQDEQRAQYTRDQAANLKFFKSQGASFSAGRRSTTVCPPPTRYSPASWPL